MGRSLHCNHAGFNPRTHTGCDQFWVVPRIVVMLFQSTHPHGVRRKAAEKRWKSSKFQSTHPHGVRQEQHQFCEFVACFNPRTHTGCDTYCVWSASNLQVSIHAPTRGATDNFINVWTQSGFQSTHPHGVRQMSVTKHSKRALFQSTHPHGVRLARS